MTESCYEGSDEEESSSSEECESNSETHSDTELSYDFENPLQPSVFENKAEESTCIPSEKGTSLENPYEEGTSLENPLQPSVFENKAEESTCIPSEKGTYLENPYEEGTSLENPLQPSVFENKEAEESTCVPSEEGTSLENPYEGQKFNNLGEAKAYYSEYARKMGFGVRVRDTRREKTRDDQVTRVVLCCDREGIHVKKLKPQPDSGKPVIRRITSTQKCGCLARFRVVLDKSGKWVVNQFFEVHNHKPVTPTKQMCMKGRRHMPKVAKDLVESFREINLPVGKVVTLLDGKTVGFDERDCYNHLGSTKAYKTPIEGDAIAMANFFCKKQTEDPQFFYAIQTDKDSRAVNFLWIDGRSRSQYQYFGDVLYFDTTYKKNVYKMPFAPFTGVNHHLQSIQFGCALLLDETEETFVWAFETWLKGMGGSAPKAMITDQDAAMTAAVARVFPDTRHRYCLWHILKKFPEKLNHVYKKKSKFKKQIKWCISGFYRVFYFENRWSELMVKYELTENDWLKKLYDMREKWIPVYHLDTFYAGMNTTGRSEGMNSFYKRFFTRHTTLREFAYKNERCLHRLVEREKKEDYTSEHKVRVVEGTSYLLQFAAKIYTKEVYSKFKRQWDIGGSRYKLWTSSNVDEIQTCIYKARNEKDPREWKVEFNTRTLEGKCECKLFESMSIPCGHLIKLFQSRDIDELPDYFIARRWLQGANEYRAKYDGGVVSGHQNSRVLRSNHLAKMANALAYEASEEDESYTFMAQKFLEFSIQLKEHRESLKPKTFSCVDSNNLGDTVDVDTSQAPPIYASQPPPTDANQAPPIDASQAPPNDASQAPPNDPSQAPPTDASEAPPVESQLLNPRISKTKGREKDSHKSTSDRMKSGFEKNQRKREFKQRECTLCKANGLPAVGHNMRTCALNPDRKK